MRKQKHCVHPGCGDLRPQASVALPETTFMQCLQMMASRDTIARLQDEAKPIVLAITVQNMVAVAPTGEQLPFAVP